MALGKHNVISAHVSRLVARRLGNALAYPPNPYAPAGDPVPWESQEEFRTQRDVLLAELGAGILLAVEEAL